MFMYQVSVRVSYELISLREIKLEFRSPRTNENEQFLLYKIELMFPTRKCTHVATCILLMRKFPILCYSNSEDTPHLNDKVIATHTHM